MPAGDECTYSTFEQTLLSGVKVPVRRNCRWAINAHPINNGTTVHRAQRDEDCLPVPTGLEGAYPGCSGYLWERASRLLRERASCARNGGNIG